MFTGFCVAQTFHYTSALLIKSIVAFYLNCDILFRAAKLIIGRAAYLPSTFTTIQCQ